MRDYYYIMAIIYDLHRQGVPEEITKPLYEWTEENCEK